MQTLIKKQIARRLENLQDFIANQRLAGLEVDDQTKTDLTDHAYGKITIDEVIKRIHQRIENNEF